MRITIFGSSIVSAYWNGAATYYRGMCQALDARGHQIRFVEQDIFDRQRHRDFASDPAYCEVSVVTGWEGLRRELEQAWRSAELIIKCNDTGAFDREMEEWLAGDRAGGGPLVAFWDVDAPATLAECAVPSFYLRALVPRFDCVFTYGGGDAVIEGYRALGARHVVPIYNAVDPSAYYPVPPSPDYACDLFFMGNRMPDREARFHHFFLGAAEMAPAAQFILGGEGWAGLRLPANVRYVGHCPTALHPVLNSSARLVLNINRAAMAATGYSPPTRVFEAAACGACLVTDAWAGIAQFFAPGDELLVARGPDDIVRYLYDLSRPQARAIGARARQRALRDHTYTSRADTFEDAVQRLLSTV